jgi:hypothetical protein
MAGGPKCPDSQPDQRAVRPAASADLLKDEICRLRQRMELVYLEEHSLRSERVIEASRRLDKKINEYMRHKRRNTGKS